MNPFTDNTFWGFPCGPPFQTWAIWTKNIFSNFHIVNVNWAVFKVISTHNLCVMFVRGVSNHALQVARQFSFLNFSLCVRRKFLPTVSIIANPALLLRRSMYGIPLVIYVSLLKTIFLPLGVNTTQSFLV